MSKVIKKWLVYGFVLTLILSIGISNQSLAAKKKRFGFAVMDLANPYFATLAKGFVERCKQLGIKCTVTDSKLDATAQVNAVETFIAAGMDLIVCAPVDPKAIEPLVKKAHKAGIKFLSDAQIVKGSDGYITLNEYDYGVMGGKMAGEWLKKNFKGPVEVAILDFPELKPVIDRARGLADGVKQLYPAAKIVANQSASTPETGMRATETILQAHPHVKVIVAINDAGALGAYEAVKAMGKAKDDFYIGGLDATPEALAKIKEGGIYRGTVDIDPFGTGALCVDTGLKILKNGPLKGKILVPMYPITQEEAKKRK
jgi:ribose transport system substrate-binding protein